MCWFYGEGRGTIRVKPGMNVLWRVLGVTGAPHFLDSVLFPRARGTHIHPVMMAMPISPAPAIVRVIRDDIFQLFFQDGTLSFQEAFQCLLISGTVPAADARAVTQQIYGHMAQCTQQVFQLMLFQAASFAPPTVAAPMHHNLERLQAMPHMQLPPCAQDVPPPETRATIIDPFRSLATAAVNSILKAGRERNLSLSRGAARAALVTAARGGGRRRSGRARAGACAPYSAAAAHAILVATVRRRGARLAAGEGAAARRRRAWAFFQWRRFLLKRLEYKIIQDAKREKESHEKKIRELEQTRDRIETQVRAARRKERLAQDRAQRWWRALAGAYAQLYDARRGGCLRMQVPRALLWSLMWIQTPLARQPGAEKARDRCALLQEELLMCAKGRSTDKEVCCRLIVDPHGTGGGDPSVAVDSRLSSSRALMSFLVAYADTELWRVHLCIYNRPSAPRRVHLHLLGFLPCAEWEEYLIKGFVPDRYNKELRCMSENKTIMTRLRRRQQQGLAAQKAAAAPAKTKKNRKKDKRARSPNKLDRMESFPKMEIRALIPSRKQWMAWGGAWGGGRHPRASTPWARASGHASAQAKLDEWKARLNVLVQQTYALRAYHFLSQLDDK